MTYAPIPAAAPTPTPSVPSARSSAETRNAWTLRGASAGMVTAAAAWNVLPFHPPLRCPLLAATGVPCPLCGMTRAVVAAVHGHIGTSLAFNPGGILVLLLAAVALVRPRWLTRLRAPTWTVLAVVAGLWLWNVGFNPTFHQLLLR